MAKKRTITRQYHPAPSEPLDDKVWPICIALCILGGALIGAILAYLRFDDPRWYCNAIFWLAAVPIALGNLFLAICFLGGRIVRRTLQFALILSILIHLLFFIAIFRVEIFERFWPQQSTTAELLQRREESTVPDYHAWQVAPQETPQQDFQRPVATETPDPRPEEVVREEFDEPPTPVAPQPTPVLEQAKPRLPNTQMQRTESESVPRRSSSSSQLSRQTNQAQPIVGQSAATTPNAAARNNRPNPLSPQSIAMNQQASRKLALRRPDQNRIETANQQPTVELQRRRTEQAPRTESAAAPTSRRSEAQASVTPRTEAQMNDVSNVARVRQPQAIQPSNATALKRAAASEALSRAESSSKSPSSNEVDFGPAQAASASGARRASSSGQISINPQAAAMRLARSTTSGAPNTTATVQRLATETAAPSRAEVGLTGSQSGSNAEITARLSATSALFGAKGPSTDATAAPVSSQSGAALLARVNSQRAEAANSGPSQSASGGEAASPPRRAASSLSTNTQAAMASASGARQTGNRAAQSGALAAQIDQPSSASGGPTAPVRSGPSSSFAAAPSDAPLAPTAGVASGRRQTAPTAADGPQVGSLSSAAPPQRRRGRLGPPRAIRAQIAAVSSQSNSPSPTSESENAGGGVGPLSRSAPGALAIDRKAVEGPGGVGDRPSLNVGVNSRRAVKQSMQIQPRTARFIRQKVGGPLSINTAAVAPSDAFRRRGSQRSRQGPSALGVPGPETEAAIELGLTFLAKHQTAEGGWTLQGFDRQEASLASDAAATALALLAFQGAGYNHREHKYKQTVLNGIDYLIKNQKENGDLYIPGDEGSNASARLYTHSIASLALCEAYGMTGDPMLRQPAQKAIDFIVASQHPQQGGWRYAPGVGADTSVTGWMMMALKSGQLANLKVPAETYEKIRHWLEVSQDVNQKHLYRYNPFAPDTPTQRHGRNASKTMTAVGLLMRFYTGWRRDTPLMARGADYLKENLPTLGDNRAPQRDTYYWYYATQVMFHMGGEHWKAWNGGLHPLLVGSQIQEGSMAGSWNPLGPIPDRWGPHAGRLYVTTMNLLSLEVYYRHLPLYEETAK